MPYEEREYNALRCLISVPPGQAPKEGWPVLVFLHGAGEDAPLNLPKAMTRHGPLSPGANVLVTGRFLVIAPQLPAPGGNVWGERSQDVDAIAIAAATEFRGNQTQIFLTGFC